MKRTSFLNYLFIIAIITVIFGAIYAAVQQSYRTATNDPQIQIVRDIDLRLHNGKSVESFFTDAVDIAQSLSTFAALYDVNGKPVSSSGYLNGSMIRLPSGVFDFARSHDEYEVTWQPQIDIRMAMVIIKTNAYPVGFVACGRSLQQVEIREHSLVTITFIGWLVCIAVILMHAVFQFYFASQRGFNI